VHIWPGCSLHSFVALEGAAMRRDPLMLKSLLLNRSFSSDENHRKITSPADDRRVTCTPTLCSLVPTFHAETPCLCRVALNASAPSILAVRPHSSLKQLWDSNKPISFVANDRPEINTLRCVAFDCAFMLYHDVHHVFTVRYYPKDE
jgi:hypothetical protein